MRYGSDSGTGPDADIPRKSRDWVKKQCFPALDHRAWTFPSKTEERTPEGKPIWKRLVYAGKTKIRRHLKIR